MKKLFILLTLLSIALIYTACKEDDEIDPEPEVFEATPYNFTVPQGFPTDLNIPDDNPLTVEGVKLGRYLFYDGRLAGRGDHPDSLMSCGTCHLQERGFECGVDHPKYTNGFTFGLPTKDFPNGKPTPHVMLPLVNLVFNSNGYLWNGMIHESNTKLGGYGTPNEEPYNMKNIESLVWMGIVAPHEMAGSVEKSVNAIANIPMYPPMFKDAFGTEEVNYDRISKAIAQFVRTIISYRSNFHKSLRGEYTLTDAERRGLILFVTEPGADCFHCHGGDGNPLMTTNSYYNNAKDTSFTGPNEDPRDRYHITGDPQDLGAYKAPSLINCELVGPYMHDGRFATLDEVINFYSEGLKWSPYANPLMHKLAPPWGTGAQLLPSEKADLKAFLLSLTDHELLTDQQYSKPSDLNF